MAEQSTDGMAAIITGASSGIGRSVAEQLATRGYKLLLAARRPEALQAVAEATGGVAVSTDVGQQASVEAMVDRAYDEFGRVDVLVNNAGLAPLKPIDEHTGEELDAIYRVNALGPAWAIARVWARMKAGGGGRIVNVSTIGTADPFPGFFGYASAKAAVNLMAQSVASEGEAHNIRGFAVAPGAVETPMLRSIFGEDAIPPENCLKPSDVAEVVVACAMGERDDENGRTIFVPSP